MLSKLKLEISNPLKTIVTGSRTLKYSNLGWILIFPLLILNLVIFPFIGFELLTVSGMALSVMFSIVLMVLDVVGYTILGVGLLKSRNYRKNRVPAGLAFLGWVVFSLLWRAIFCYGLLGVQVLHEDTKYLLYTIIQWSYLAGSLSLLVAAYFIVKSFDGTLPFIVYSCINVLAAYFTGPVFIFITDEVYVQIGTLVLMIIVFKLITIPCLGIASFNGLIESIQILMQSEKSHSTNKDVTTAYLDVKLKKTHIESTLTEGFKGKTVIEQKKVKHAVIECPKCRYQYPVNTIHVNCLYCGERLLKGNKLPSGQ